MACNRQTTLLLTTLGFSWKLVFPVLIPSFGRSFKMPGQSEPAPRSPPLFIHPSILSIKWLVGGLLGACLLDGWMDGWWSPCCLLSEWMDGWMDGWWSPCCLLSEWMDGWMDGGLLAACWVSGWMVSGQETVLCWGSSFHGGLAHLLLYYPPCHPFTWWLSHCPRPPHFENASHPQTSLLECYHELKTYVDHKV